MLLLLADHSYFYQIPRAPQTMDKSPHQDFPCICGLSFPMQSLLQDHQSSCDHAQVEEWEETLKSMTSPGAECFPCCRLLSLDDVLFNGQVLIYRTYEESTCCSSCRDAWYPYEGRAMLQRQDVQRYLHLRRTTVPFPWLKEYRAQLFRELQEYLHQCRSGSTADASSRRTWNKGHYIGVDWLEACRGVVLCTKSITSGARASDDSWPTSAPDASCHPPLALQYFVDKM